MEFQLSYFKSKKMMLWKCCSQYASKFGKLSSGHRAGKGQLSCQSQRMPMQKNAQTTTQFHSSYASKVILKSIQVRLHQYVNHEIPAELFQIRKDDAVKVLHSICQQICKTQQWVQDWKISVFIRIPKKNNANKCSNYHKIALILPVNKVMHKTLQVRLQQYFFLIKWYC